MQLIPVYIQELCQDHDYVVIPGLGGFMKRYRPARMHPTSFHFTPPGTTFVFNERLRENDGLLVARVAMRQQIHSMEAERMVTAYTRSQLELLQAGETIQFPGIGRLVRDPEGSLRFTADPTASYEPSAFGLPAFQASPIRKKAVVTAPPEIPVTARKERRISSVLGWLAAACVVLALLFLPMQNSGGSGSHQLANLFDSIRAQQNEQIALLYAAEQMPANSSVSSTRETNEPTTAVLVIAEPVEQVVTGSGFWLVCGAFKEQANAENQQERLRNSGFEAAVQVSGDLHMVVVPVPQGTDRYAYRQSFAETTGIKGAWLKKE